MSTKVSELTSLGSAPADTDVIPVVDVSDTSQAASGTLKKLAASYLAKTDGTAATITGGGTVALGGYTLTVGATGTASLDGHAHAASAITSGTLDDARVAESNVTQHQAALSITESQISDLGTYLTTVAINDVSDVTIDTPADNEVLAYNSGTGTWINQTPAEAGLAEASHNQAASTITSGTFDDARIAESNVTQHQAALAITESQISDLGSYEAALGNPGTDGYVLSSTTGGTRSWVAAGLDEFVIPLHTSSFGTSSGSYVEFGNNSMFYWSSAWLPTGYSVYFAASGKKSASATAYVALSEADAATPITNGELSFTTTSFVRAETPALTLVDGTYYEVIVKIGTATQTATGASPCLIIRKD